MPNVPIAEDPLQVYEDRSKLGRHLTTLVQQTEHVYQQYLADEAVRNLAYYRGSFWMGDGSTLIRNTDVRDYRAQQNEVFPILDTIKSALAMDLPQVEAIKQTFSSAEVYGRAQDPTIRGRRVSAILNLFAEEDDLDETTQELVLNALLFRYAVMKVSWSREHGRPIVRCPLPWEVFFDPAARRAQDAAWVFERITVHWADFKNRIEGGVYEASPQKPIIPDSYPRSLIEQTTASGALDPAEERMRKAGLKEYVSLVEFWDFRRQRVYHLHVDTGQLLMEVAAPYRNPYEVLVFHPGVGRVEGVSDTSLMAPVQRDINELVSARLEMVRRLVPRMLFDRSFWKDEKDWSRFIKARQWQPTRVDVPPQRRLQDAYHVVEPPQSTYDFNRHLEDDMVGVRRVAGEADYQRGVHRNIRTAEEMQALRSSVEGRLGTRVNRVVKVVSRMFKHMLHVTRWALENPEVSGIDLERITYETQDDVGPEIIRQDLLHWAGKFRLLPFSPAMEDKLARRGHLERMLVHLLAAAEKGLVDGHELIRELVDEFGLRPSLVAPPPPPDEAAAPANVLPMPGAAAGPPQFDLANPPSLPLPIPQS